MHGAAPSHIRPANEKGFRMRIDRAIVGGAVCALCVALAAIAATAQPPGTVKQFGARSSQCLRAGIGTRTARRRSCYVLRSLMRPVSEAAGFSVAGRRQSSA